MVDDLKYQGVRFELYLVWSRELLKGFDQSMSSGGGGEKRRERENIKIDVRETVCQMIDLHYYNSTGN